MIKCQNIGVQYTRKYHREQSIKDFFIASLAKQRKDQQFWALQDISFDLGKGEIMGVIGTNGSGKSTLLKVLGGLLEPDSGSIEVKGTVAPLLELGLGFEPSLSGAENIYLNGSILKMKRSEINDKFDAIVEFSGIKDVIDSPLIHYSTGMIMRLGFAIASHSAADILLIDEILAVGDFIFQEKCISRITEMNQRGVSIVFVSHSMDLVKRFCRRAIWIDNGVARSQGGVDEVVEDYQMGTNPEYRLKKEEEKRRLEAEEARKKELLMRKGKDAEIINIEFLAGNGQTVSSVKTSEAFMIKVHFNFKIKIENPIFGLAIHHKDGAHICGPNTQDCRYPIRELEGRAAIVLNISSLNLVPGDYVVSFVIWDSTHTYAYDWEEKSFSFTVENPGWYKHRGYVPLDYRWEIIK